MLFHRRSVLKALTQVLIIIKTHPKQKKQTSVTKYPNLQEEKLKNQVKHEIFFSSIAFLRIRRLDFRI